MTNKIQEQNWLESILLLVNMSPAELAKAANLDQGLISRLRRDLTRPTPDTLNAIAQATGLPPELVFRRAKLLPSEGTELDDWAIKVATRISKLPAESRNFIENTIEYFYELERRKGKK